VESGDLDGELGTTLLLRQLPGVAAPRVLLVGLGAEGAFRERHYREAVVSAIKALCATGAREAALTLHELPVAGRDGAWKLEQAVLAGQEAVYRFDQLKSRAATRHALEELLLLVPDRADAPAAEAAVQRALAIGEGITLAKDLGNLPGNLCTPSHLAQVARELAQAHGLATTILEQRDIEQLGMGAFLAVTRGSRQPPRLIVMAYRGSDADTPPIVLVGKGITFDTGGISIKPAHEMDEMKFDMCGAASVFGTLRAAALMRLRLNVVGIVPATENMPGGNAMKPGDVVTTLSGQTVEILDTDCEGRLVLCDALTYAQRHQPAVVVDIATLTGEIVGALGDVASGLFSNSDALAQEMVQAGQQAWDRVWPMPLWDDYQEALKSNFADLPNIGSGRDCAVTPVCFLSRFIADGTPWVHLDIAGTAAKGGADKGATGRPVALLAHWLAERAATQAGSSS
jgi:leucyl aminopeptidase